MQGRIVKGIAGFYYVDTRAGLIECKAKGVFRKDGKKPLVGDEVELELVDEGKRQGSITELLPRKSQLIRPAIANIDQALLIFAMTKPAPNYNLLDRFLITMERQQLPCVLCFNKADAASREEQGKLLSQYGACGCPVLFVSAKCRQGFEELERELEGKITVMAGPSGVGKSTLINALYPDACMETGEISRKIDRGRHTTRHTQLFPLGENTYLCDTPGFTSLSLGEMEKEELAGYYPEFALWEEKCRFKGCSHIGEPDCGVKQALSEGKISRMRYDNYVLLYEELKNRKRYERERG